MGEKMSLEQTRRMRQASEERLREIANRSKPASAGVPENLVSDRDERGTSERGDR